MAMRVPGVWMALGLLAGCVSDGSFADRGPGSSGIRWSGPYGGDPYFRGPYGFGGGPFGSSYYGARSYGGRTFRPNPDVVCDRATETCYRGRDIDASETRDHFGRSAARRVDRIRDAAGTNRIYRASDDVVCNRQKEICFKNGHPDRSETRDFFGKKAARRID
jgi:hypothetical protein